MSDGSEYSVILTTVDTETAAATLAQSIIDRKLGACVQVLAIKSFYVWKGEHQSDNEWLLLVKTRHDLYEPLSEHITNNHPYETPEIVELPISQGSHDYLSWIDASTSS